MEVRESGRGSWKGTSSSPHPCPHSVGEYFPFHSFIIKEAVWGHRQGQPSSRQTGRKEIEIQALLPPGVAPGRTPVSGGYMQVWATEDEKALEGGLEAFPKHCPPRIPCGFGHDCQLGTCCSV